MAIIDFNDSRTRTVYNIYIELIFEALLRSVNQIIHKSEKKATIQRPLVIFTS